MIASAACGDDKIYEGGSRPKAEEHHAVEAMIGGEVAEGYMREVSDKVQVAYHGSPGGDGGSCTLLANFSPSLQQLQPRWRLERREA
jgi:hypothetical protein